MTEPVHIATIRKNGSGDEVRVTLDNFKGHDTLDLRVFSAFTAANVPMPTKKGLTVAVRLLPELELALRQAEGKARELRMLGDSDEVPPADPDLIRLVDGLKARGVALGWGAVDAALGEIDRLRGEQGQEGREAA